MKSSALSILSPTFFAAAALLIFCGTASARVANDTEAGVVITNGNTRTQSWNLKDESKYSFDKNDFRLDANYLKAKQLDAVTAETWQVGLRYERELSTGLNAFAGQNIEGDTFAGFLQRYNSDLGAKCFFSKKEKDLVWFAEAGYRYTSEHGTDGGKRGFQKGRLYNEIENYWAATTSTKLTLEYIPNFTRSSEWLLNAEASVSSALNAVFSVKTAYSLRYNNMPPVAGLAKTDTTFTTALVAKF